MILASILVCVGVAQWESKRRSVFVEYSLAGSGLHAYQEVLDGFNQLASCEQVWILDTLTRITTLKDFKDNAGASEVVRRRTVRIGAGSPPWMEANLTVPTIIARGQTLYFLPDCILVYDSTGVGNVSYSKLEILCGTTSFIEKSPPGDSQIVGRTWLHPNKDGGPDRRYGVNYEIAICLYGTMVMVSENGLFLYFHTSRSGTPNYFQSGLRQLASGTFGRKCESLRPNIEVNPEHFESLAVFTRSAITSRVKWCDNVLSRVSGEGNTIVHGFLRVLAIGTLFITIGTILYFIVQSLFHSS
jgi:hypothetical protein